jgi:hypothetical protein
MESEKYKKLTEEDDEDGFFVPRDPEDDWILPKVNTPKESVDNPIEYENSPNVSTKDNSLILNPQEGLIPTIVNNPNEPVVDNPIEYENSSSVSTKDNSEILNPDIKICVDVGIGKDPETNKDILFMGDITLHDIAGVVDKTNPNNRITKDNITSKIQDKIKVNADIDPSKIATISQAYEYTDNKRTSDLYNIRADLTKRELTDKLKQSELEKIEKLDKEKKEREFADIQNYLKILKSTVEKFKNIFENIRTKIGNIMESNEDEIIDEEKIYFTKIEGDIERNLKNFDEKMEFFINSVSSISLIGNVTINFITELLSKMELNELIDLKQEPSIFLKNLMKSYIELFTNYNNLIGKYLNYNAILVKSKNFLQSKQSSNIILESPKSSMFSKKEQLTLKEYFNIINENAGPLFNNDEIKKKMKPSFYGTLKRGLTMSSSNIAATLGQTKKNFAASLAQTNARQRAANIANLGEEKGRALNKRVYGIELGGKKTRKMKKNKSQKKISKKIKRSIRKRK